MKRTDEIKARLEAALVKECVFEYYDDGSLKPNSFAIGARWGREFGRSVLEGECE